ncbi:fumarylacetoacetate hydrolase family protein [Brucella tritici]|uniref:Fumarylacetoacetate hydrolase family protein n=1 Tax=Brucella tritici TaxID=94626 RepID=A0A7X6JCI8_9HYPH|nr:fumarylacetoacetate hydrolase family protein [Brucella tritici]KAB2662300.1 fumarylacetoacetate hydrolase family protein [Brucella tritici]NKW10647.1 fumarylacetoacetate hydrolase family protein [Brucella tritici]
MKIIRFAHNGAEHWGLLEDDKVRALPDGPFGEIRPSPATLPLDAVRLLAPVKPGKLVCVGLNYVLHARESGLALPDEPMLFMCSPQAIIGPNEAIVLDSQDKRIEFEAELAIVIGKRARNIQAAEASSVVLGYTCANDVSNRDLQIKDKQFTRAKSFDTYKPIGPFIQTGLDPDNQSIRLLQNGEVRQDSTTADMIFPTSFIIEFVSSVMTLEPGDVIITGTPSGVGPMKSGDKISIEISGIGTLENPVQ